MQSIDSGASVSMNANESPTTTFDEAHKFGMFVLKAVLDGRGGELIDLATVNLTR